MEMTIPDAEPKQRERLEVRSFLMPTAQEQENEEEDIMMVEKSPKPLVNNLDLRFLQEDLIPTEENEEERHKIEESEEPEEQIVKKPKTPRKVAKKKGVSPNKFLNKNFDR